MNILFLVDSAPPEGSASAARLWDHATRWVKAGHGVTVITCAPNYPDGKVYPGYSNRWYRVELIDEVRVVRVKTYITANEGFFKRTLDYLSFMVSSFVAGLFQKRSDIVVATSPQFFTACAGWAVAAVRRLPFVFEVRDLWPASIVAVGAMKESLAIRVLEQVEMFLYRRATAIVSLTESFREELAGRGVDRNKIHVVVNGVDLARYQPAVRSHARTSEFGLEEKFVVGYIGTHGMAHRIDKVVEAAVLLRDRQDIAFLLVGGGAERARVEAMVKDLRLQNVVLVARQPKERMPEIWRLCDLALVPLKNAPLFRTVIPSKIFESMAMGIPVLMSVPEGEATGIVRKAGCGMCVPPEDPVALAAAIEQLADDQDMYGRLAAAALSVASDYSRDTLAASMLEVLQIQLQARPIYPLAAGNAASRRSKN